MTKKIRRQLRHLYFNIRITLRLMWIAIQILFVETRRVSRSVPR